MWTYDALVCDNVGDVIIGGNPLLDQGINPVTYRYEIDIVTKDGSIRKLPWRPQTFHHPISPNIGILRSEETITLYPGEHLDIQAPPKFQSLGDAEVLVRPRSTSNIFAVYQTTTKYARDLFPTPLYTWMINGRVRIPNDSSLPITIPKHKHIAEISLVTSRAVLFPSFKPSPFILKNSHVLKNISYSNGKQLPDPSLYPRPKPVPPVCQVEQVVVYPDNILEPRHRKYFSEINKKYSEVFSS